MTKINSSVSLMTSYTLPFVNIVSTLYLAASEWIHFTCFIVFGLSHVKCSVIFFILLFLIYVFASFKIFSYRPLTSFSMSFNFIYLIAADFLYYLILPALSGPFT